MNGCGSKSLLQNHTSPFHWPSSAQQYPRFSIYYPYMIYIYMRYYHFCWSQHFLPDGQGLPYTLMFSPSGIGQLHLLQVDDCPMVGPTQHKNQATTKLTAINHHQSSSVPINSINSYPQKTIMDTQIYIYIHRCIYIQIYSQIFSIDISIDIFIDVYIDISIGPQIFSKDISKDIHRYPHKTSPKGLLWQVPLDLRASSDAARATRAAAPAALEPMAAEPLRSLERLARG